jgi:Predicted membrane protein
MENKSDARAKKKAEFSEPPQRKSKTTLMLLTVFVVLVGIGAYMVLSASNDNPSATTVATAPASTPSDSRDIRITLSDLSGTAKFFDYKLSDNKPIRFFVIKSSDGVYRAALDACDTCYHAKKGYHQEGDDMVCNNCGLHFHSSQINEVHGGCNPVGLPRTIEGNQLVIKGSELESRGAYF